MLEPALAYAKAGWSVFALRKGGKTPAGGHGYLDATTDPGQITEWWTDRPDANIGIATGASGLLVVDIDAKSFDANGWTSWLALVDKVAGAETPTLEVTTPTGGAHIYFGAPAGPPVGNTAGKLCPNVDTRGVGGYVVATPSVTDQGRYELETPARPIAPCPDWLTKLLRPPERPRTPPGALTPLTGRTPYGTKALTEEAAAVAAAPEGTRNHRLNEAAFSVGQLVARGDIDQADAVTTLLDAARRAGLTDRESETTIASGLRAGHNTPRVVA